MTELNVTMGVVQRDGVAETWANIRGGNGNGVTSDYTTYGATIRFMICPSYISASPNGWSSLRRAIGYVDTSSLGGATVLSAVYRVKFIAPVIENASWTNCGVVMVNANPAATDHLANSDFQTCGTTAYSEVITDDSMVADADRDIALNAAGLAALNAVIAVGGIFKFAIIESGYDRSGTIPDETQTANYRQAVLGWSTSQQTKIIVEEYTLTVQTDPATEVSSTSAVLNGTLVDGGDDVTCSFMAGLTTDCTDWAGGSQNVDEPNSFDAEFDAVAAGIPPGSTVYFKAKAVSGGVTAYGEVLSFTLANFPTVGTTRVSGLVHRWQPGHYVLEVNLGGLASGRGVPVPSGNYEKAIPTGTTQQPLQITRDMYESWLRNTDINVILQSFGHFPSFEEWVTWYVSTAASWGY